MDEQTARIVPDMGRKKKNTYCIGPVVSYKTPKFYELGPRTELPVISKNGVLSVGLDGENTIMAFPNPGAHELVVNYELVGDIDSKIAQTVIEYLDKVSGVPVLYVFPTMMYVCDDYRNTYWMHLNHASRRDLNYQLKLRRRIIERIFEKTRGVI